MTELTSTHPPFPLLLLKQTILDLDRVRHTLSTEFTLLRESFDRHILKSTRIVPEVYGKYHDGSPSRVKLALLFKQRERLKMGFRRVGRKRTLLRYLPQPLDHDELYRRGELRNAGPLLALQEKLNLLNSAGKAVNRAAFSLSTSLRLNSVPQPTERLLPPVPPPWSHLRFQTFPSSVSHHAWGFTVRYSRSLGDARRFTQDYAADPPSTAFALQYSWDRDHPSGRLTWRVKPDHRRISELTEGLLRELHVPTPLRRRLLEFEKRRRAHVRTLQGFYRVFQRIRKNASEAIQHGEKSIAVARAIQIPYSTLGRTTG